MGVPLETDTRGQRCNCQGENKGRCERKGGDWSNDHAATASKGQRRGGSVVLVSLGWGRVGDRVQLETARLVISTSKMYPLYENGKWVQMGV